jgi:hypothetical protein
MSLNKKAMYFLYNMHISTFRELCETEKKKRFSQKCIPCFKNFYSWIEFGDPNESVIRQISANGNIDFPEIDESEG